DNAKKALAEREDLLAERNALLDTLRLDYKALVKTNADTALDLAELARRMKEAQDKSAGLEKDLHQKKTEVLAAAKKFEEQTALLQEAEARGKKLEQQLAEVRVQGKDYQTKLSVFDIRSKLLEQDLDKSRKDLLDTSKRYQELALAQELLSNRLLISSKEL